VCLARWMCDPTAESDGGALCEPFTKHGFVAPEPRHLEPDSSSRDPRGQRSECRRLPARWPGSHWPGSHDRCRRASTAPVARRSAILVGTCPHVLGGPTK